jgi:hypothetical protein
VSSPYGFSKDEYPAHSTEDVLTAWAYTIKNRDVLSVERIEEYGLWWELMLSIWYTRGNLYWDYRNGDHPADEILSSVCSVARKLQMNTKGDSE